MMRAVLLLVAALAGPALAEDFVTPPASLVLDGVPPIPADLAKQVRPYGELRPHALLSWHPYEREMLVRRRLDATNQVHRVSAPNATPEPLTDLPNAIGATSYQPTHGKYFVFAMAERGNEVYRLHRYDIATKAITPISPEGERAGGFEWNRAGDRLVYTTVRIDRNNPDRTSLTTVHVVDPAQPESDRVLAKFTRGTWVGFRFSEDGKQLAFVEFVSVNQSHLWVMDAASGKKRRVTPAAGKVPVAWRSPRFTKDGRSLFATTDRGSEFMRLVQLPLAPGARERVLTGHLKHDVDAFDISFEARMIAFTTNQNGAHSLRIIDLATFKEQPRPALVEGVIGGLEWRPRSYEVGLHLASAHSAGDVFSYDVKANQFTRWTNGNHAELNMRDFPQARLVKWKSFDDLEISGYLYSPPDRFTGKRPVIVNIHGGPEAQAKPGFLGRNAYLVRELGIAMIYPNVRGSTGLGKTYARLDNGRKREDAVKDIGALLDWIALQPDLDASRVMVMGGSYGGYMALAASVHFADRIAGAVSVVGISNFVTFLERTETYRRDLRRAEYGDERVPQMRAFLESISPLKHAGKITKPLLVAQGLNDPRVPHAESEQIVASLKSRGAPVWFVMAKDEGHGFAKKPNADYLFYATVEFARRALLQVPEPPKLTSRD